MISVELDIVQKKLHDGAVIWSRVELLRWLNDGYRQFLALSKATLRFWNIDLPGGFTFAGTQEWEGAFAGGSFNRFSFPVKASNFAATNLWETEFIEGISPSATLANCTQPWERSHLSDWDGYYRFALPRDHESIKRVAWDERRLHPVTVKELDHYQTDYNRLAGEPVVFTAGLGRVKTFEIYAIETTLVQGYELKEAERGIPRRFTGRTYAQSGPDPEVGNAYAYATSGDHQALDNKGSGFDPTVTYSNPGDKASTTSARPWRFTFTGISTGSQYSTQSDLVSTHPWEIDSSITSLEMYGTHPFEIVFGAAVSRLATDTIQISGLGWRFTTPAASESNGFAVHNWEKQILDGATANLTSVTIGTYRWEQDFGAKNTVAFRVGTVRRISSPDRQYMPVYLGPTGQRLLGTPRDFKSSTDMVQVLQVVIPNGELAEADSPDLIPSQMLKYLRFYVLSRAFGRQGEGHNGILAAHYDRRFRDGAKKFNRIGMLAHRDIDFSRQPLRPERTTPPAPKLPPEFPRIDI